MNQKRAVLFLPEDSSRQPDDKPLMLESVLFCPLLSWVARELTENGVERFFVVCGKKYAEEARACFADPSRVTISTEHADLMEFLAGDGEVQVFPCPVVPVGGMGMENYVYTAPAEQLRAGWDGGEKGDIPGAKPVDGYTAVYRAEELARLLPVCRGAVLRRHIAAGVQVLDPAAVYVDPRVEIGAGTVLLPGAILRGRTRIGRRCEIGPNAMLRDCTVGDETTVNASQLNESTVGDHTNVGPFAYVRPGSHIGDHVKVGDFVEVKNSSIGDGTKISHLTYVGDSDVGQRVNFGCGTVTTNYDGFRKYRCDIGDDAFLGCNTNLIAPVRVGRGAYTAAGSTITKDVPPDALAIARAAETVKEGWAERRRRLHESAAQDHPEKNK